MARTQLPTSRSVDLVLSACTGYSAAVAASGVQAFSVATVENVAKVIGELYSGSELTRILISTSFRTHWRRA